MSGIDGSQIFLHRRRSLRKNMPEPENRIWYYLRARRLKNLKFRRQYSLGSYIIDFYCSEKNLAIEIDGDTHFYNQDIEAYDSKRQEYIESRGIHVLRFTNREVVENITGVLEQIREIVNDNHPSP